jgi:hypothetical protein
MGMDLMETDIRLPSEEEIRHHPEYNQGKKSRLARACCGFTWYDAPYRSS